MSHIFISHAAKDFEIASRIRASLNEAGLTTWMAMADLETGDDWKLKTDEALKNASGMVVVLSPAALNSPSVTYEYSYILGQNKRLYPVMVDSVPIEDFPYRLGNINYFDLTNDFKIGIRGLIAAIQNPSYLASSETQSPQVNVRLKIDRTKLSSLMATLIEAGAEKIEVENVGKPK